MEDITDEIKDLQQSINATGGEGEDGGAPRRPVDLECSVTDSMQVGFVRFFDFFMFLENELESLFHEIRKLLLIFALRIF